MPLVIAIFGVVVVIALSATAIYVCRMVVDAMERARRQHTLDRVDLIAQINDSFTHATKLAVDVIADVSASQQATLGQLVDMVHGPQDVSGYVDEHPELDMSGEEYLLPDDPYDGIDTDDIGWPMTSGGGEGARIEPADQNAYRAVSVRPGERLIGG